MGRKNKPRLIPKQNQKLCRSICLCQLTMVLSCVAIVYLTVAIYMPSYRAFKSEFELEPVMCQTHTTSLKNNCSWVSCGEWCLTSNSGFCPQINTTVRRNGTDVIFQNCTPTSVTATSCPDVSITAYKRFNCNNGTECSSLTGLFVCIKGHCKSLADLYSCQYKADGENVDADKDNIKLNGFFECKDSKCVKIKKPLQCMRYCPLIKTADVNILVMEDDTVVGANCESAVALNEARGSEMGLRIPPTNFWNATKGEILITNCLDILKTEEGYRANDCLNGTVIKSSLLPQPSINFTVFWNIYRESNTLYDPTEKYLPHQQTLTIYNNSRLYINLGACVNTLRGECKEFLESHGKFGINNTAQSRYSCFYNKKHSNYVITRYDLKKAYRELLIAAIIPTTLFVISCTFLCIVTQSVRVGDDTKMRCKYCGDNNSDQEDGELGRKSLTENEPILSPSGLQSPNDTEPGDISARELMCSSPKSIESPTETRSEIIKSATTESKLGDERPLVIL